VGKNPKNGIIYYFFFPQTQNIISFIQQVFYLLRFLQDILPKTFEQTHSAPNWCPILNLWGMY
jgi:hypothetical protein